MNPDAQGELRRRAVVTRQQVVLLAAGSLATAALLFLPMRFAVNREFWERLMDAAHVPFFAAFTIFLDAVLPARLLAPARRIALAGALATAFAAAVELVQPFTGRGESFIDFRNGFFGVAVAVSGWHAWRRGWALRLAHVAGALAIMLFVLQPAWREWRGMMWRHAHFPLLGTFESEDELRIWVPSEDDRADERTTLSRTREHASHGAHALRISTAVTQWPGVRLRMADADWSGYGALAFEVFNPGAPLALAVRVDDDAPEPRYSERFNGSVPLAGGWNYVRIPLQEIARGPKARLLRLRAVRSLLLFLDEPKERRVLHLDHVRLEKSARIGAKTRYPEKVALC